MFYSNDNTKGKMDRSRGSVLVTPMIYKERAPRFCKLLRLPNQHRLSPCTCTYSEMGAKKYCLEHLVGISQT